MALALLPAGAAQGHTVIEGAVVADLRRLADHHPHAMVDEKTPPDPRPGVNLDARQQARQGGDEARRPLQAMAPEIMTETMHQQGVNAGIGGQHLEGIARRGIAVEDAVNVFTDSLEHAASLGNLE